MICSNHANSPGFCNVAVLLAIPLLLTACGSSETESDTGSEVPAAEVERLTQEAQTRLQASEGGRLVLEAIQAHGGLEAWYQAPTSSYTWEYANVGSDTRFRSFLVADNRTRHVYHDLLMTGSFDAPDEVEGSFAWDGENAWIHPPSIQQPNPRFWGISGYYFQQIPFVLADPGVNYRLLPDEELDGIPYRMVRAYYDEGVGESYGDSYTLYVHPESGRVDAIRYTVSFGREVPPDADLPQTLFRYGDFVTVDGLTVATAFRGYSFSPTEGIGEFRNEAFADSISYRRPFDPSRMVAPEGARFVPAPGS
ncbi:MAG: hypothetical protein WD960_13440 [Gemmatimonadota bacterium]